MFISRLTEKDCEKTASLHQLSFFRGWDKSEFEEFLKSDLVKGLKIESNHQFCGFILWREIQDECEILSFVITPDWQRKGLGTDLLESFFCLIGKTDLTKIFIEVAEDNINAREFYLKHGFIQVGKRPNYYQREENTYISALNLYKELA